MPALAVALHAVNRSEAKPGDKVCVYGCGPIGLGVVLWLLDRGVTDVVAVDISQERLERAAALGAQAVLKADTDDVPARLKELHGTARTLSREAVATNVFIDAAGAPPVVPQIVSMAPVHARLVVLAAYMKPIELHLGAMLTTEMTLTTAMGYPTEMPDVLAALPRLQEKAGALISHRYAFDDILEAVGVAGTPQSAKVMVEFDKAGA